MARARTPMRFHLRLASQRGSDNREILSYKLHQPVVVIESSVILWSNIFRTCVLHLYYRAMIYYYYIE